MLFFFTTSDLQQYASQQLSTQPQAVMLSNLQSEAVSIPSVETWNKNPLILVYILIFTEIVLLFFSSFVLHWIWRESKTDKRRTSERSGRNSTEKFSPLFYTVDCISLASVLSLFVVYIFYFTNNNNLILFLMIFSLIFFLTSLSRGIMQVLFQSRREKSKGWFLFYALIFFFFSACFLSLFVVIMICKFGHDAQLKKFLG